MAPCYFTCLFQSFVQLSMIDLHALHCKLRHDGASLWQNTIRRIFLLSLIIFDSWANGWLVDHPDNHCIHVIDNLIFPNLLFPFSSLIRLVKMSLDNSYEIELSFLENLFLVARFFLIIIES